MWSSERAAAILLAVGLAACQPLPRPLADIAVPGPDLLAVPAQGGLTVLEVAGLSGARGAAFPAALAEVLQQREVPAVAGAGMRNSLFLVGQVETRDIGGDGLEVDWTWELVDDRGATVDRRQERDVLPRRDWEWAGAKALAARAAPAVLALYNAQMPSAPAEARKPLVFLAGVRGAPGDGGRTLPRALATAVQSRDLATTDRRDDATAVVEATVVVSPSGPGREKAEIRWRVTRPNGEEVGVVRQANEIPAGTLKGAWGEVAGYVALAAADGIAELVHRIPAEAAARR
ncbi:hypothetical protein [Stella sp.]|uniref:hypothetical protein n=1 Tax=Stella sp. TaxID=2912054 RepID=UPI0035B0D4E0